jgi:ribosomal-protein-serine acetyltransferase
MKESQAKRGDSKAPVATSVMPSQAEVSSNKSSEESTVDNERADDPLAKIRIELEGGFVMRPATPADNEELVKLVNTNKAFLSAWLEWAKEDFDEVKASALIERGAESRVKGRKLDLGIFQGSEYVGHVTLFGIDSETHAAEIGYWLAKNATGQGLATKACSAMIDLAFTKLNLDRIRLHTVESNAASNKLATRLGFHLKSSKYDENHLENVNLYERSRLTTVEG